MVPDAATYFNLTRMVARSRVFLDEYGPVAWEGFDFEGGYTDRITSGSGDFLTGDTLWDFKVSGYPPNPRYTLQLLIYWRMGLHSVHPEYQSIRRWVSSTPAGTRCGCWTWTGLRRSSSIGLTVS